MVQGPSTLYNRVYVDTATTGTGDVTLGSAVTNAYLTFTEAGVTDEELVTYLLEDGTDFELGRGLYDADYDLLQRDHVYFSKISGTAGTTKITLTGSATVRIVAMAEDLVPYFGDSPPDTPHPFWIRTTDFKLFGYYNDGNSEQYVELGGGSTSDGTFLPSYTYSAIPTQLAVLGARLVITDSSTATWGATIAGSGANTVMAWYNGSNWTVVGA